MKYLIIIHDCTTNHKFFLTIYNTEENTNNYCAQSVGNIPMHRLAIIQSVHQLYSTKIELKSLFSADFRKKILGKKNDSQNRTKHINLFDKLVTFKHHQ